MSYVDGYIIPLPKKNLPAYRKLARLGARIWMEHGALEYRECAGEDLQTQCGTPFPKMFKLKATDTVIFAWVVFKSRAHRDRVNSKVMADPRMKMPDALPFDPKRFLFAGFNVIVERK
jgi:uncharacterized protein YbaA (DUF1428 family)